MKIDLSPGVRGGVFDLPKPEWQTQSAKIEVSPNIFAKKDHLVCTLLEANERHSNAPHLSRTDYLLSEVYHLSVAHGAKLTKALLKSPLRFTVPFYESTNLATNEMSVRLLSKAKRDDEWTSVGDAQFDIAQRLVSCNVVSPAYFAVVGCAREESFEITSNGCLYASRLNHAISVRLPKGGVPQQAVCTLRIMPISANKLQQARVDYPQELHELAEISEIYDFETALIVDSASVLNSQTDFKGDGLGPRASPNGVPTVVEFKRQATLKLPLPPWFNEALHSVESLALFYKTAGGESWNYFTTKLRLQGPALTINVPFLARFAVVMPKDAARVPRLIATMLRVDEYVSSFRGELYAYVRYDQEKKKWDVKVNWLRALDGEDRSDDSRVTKYTEKVAVDHWDPLLKVQVKPPDDDVPKKRVAWADGTGEKPENEQPAESADDAWNRMVNPQRRPRRSIQPGTNVPKLACARDGAVISVTIASDFHAVTGKHDGALLAVYEELPDFSISTTISCRPTGDLENRLRTYLEDLSLFYNGQVESMPSEPDCIGEVRCILQSPGNVMQKFVIAVFRLIIPFENLLKHFDLQRPEPPPTQVPTSTPRISPAPPANEEPPKPPSPPPQPQNQTPPKSKAYEEMMRRIEEAANQKASTPPPEPVADRPAAPRTELIRPRIAPVLIQPPREFNREPKVLSGRSLQALSRQIEKGLTLGVLLNLKDSVISGIAFDSLSKINSNAYDVTYRVLLTWKRTSASRKLKHNQAGAALVDELVSALEQFGRPELTEAVKRAYAENVEMQPSMFNTQISV